VDKVKESDLLLVPTPVRHLFSFLLKNRLEIEFTTSAHKVNITRPDKFRSLEDFPEEVESNDNRCGKICLKEVIRVRFSPDGIQGNVKLCNQTQNVENQSDPRTPNSKSSLEGKFIEGMALDAPSSAELNMGEANGTPVDQPSDGKYENYYHVKKELKPDNARSQLKTVAPTGAILM
jgi:hypothetical protein